MSKDKIQICDIVEYGLNSFGTGPQTWRVSHWYRIAPPFEPSDSPRSWIDEILYDACQKIKGHRMQMCTEAEATHVSLTGICGTIAPISECKFVREVAWSKEKIEEERRDAEEWGAKHEMVF